LILGHLLIFVDGLVAAADLQVRVAVGVVPDQQLVVVDLQLPERGRALQQRQQPGGNKPRSSILLPEAWLVRVRFPRRTRKITIAMVETGEKPISINLKFALAPGLITFRSNGP